MFNKNKQVKILDIFKNFFLLLGIFSIGMSIYLFYRESFYVIQILLYKVEAIWLGLWAPTCFVLSLIIDKIKESIK
jgi:hypothetical protein